MSEGLANAVWKVCEDLHLNKKLITKNTVAAIISELGQWNMAELEGELGKHINAWRLHNISKKNDSDNVVYTPQLFAQKIVELETQLCKLRAQNEEAVGAIAKLSKELGLQQQKNKQLKEIVRTNVRNILVNSSEH